MKLHPIHERYLKVCPSNSADRFFDLMDQLQGKERDSLLVPVALAVIQPKTRNPDSVHETIGSLFEEHVSYSRFKAKLAELIKLVPEELLVLAVVHRYLSTIYCFAHVDVEEIRGNHLRTVDRLQRVLNSKSLPEWQRSQMSELVLMLEEKIRVLPDEKIANERFYNAFCQTVLDGLLEEDEEQAQQTSKDLVDSFERLSEDEFPGAPKEKM